MKREERIERIIESIKIIEEQIKFFEDNKPLFFQKKKIQKYNNRINCLEHIRKGLYRSLECKIDKDWKGNNFN